MRIYRSTMSNVSKRGNVARRFFVAFSAILASILGAVTTVGVANAEEVRIRIPVDYNLDNPPGDALTEFKRVLEERSEGSIVVDIYPQGNLYKGADAVQAVLRGDVEMSAVVSPHWIGISPKLSIFELPFAFPSRDAIYNAVEDEDFISSAYDEVVEKGGQLVDIFVYDYALLANSTRPLVTPDDFDGIKLRAIGKTNGRFLELLGAETVPVNITEVSLALDRGIIEGMSTAPDFWVKYKWSESVNFATEANFLIFYYPYVANLNWWNGLSDEQRSVISQSMAEAFQNMRSKVVQAHEASMAELADQGIEIHRLSPEEAQVWIEETEVLWKDAEKAYGVELLEKLKDATNVSDE